MKPSIQLGDYARDRLTGFEGYVICESQWLYGCRRLTLQPTALHEGKAVESSTFAEPQVEIVTGKEPFSVEISQPRKTGGPRPEPTRGR